MVSAAPTTTPLEVDPVDLFLRRFRLIVTSGPDDGAFAESTDGEVGIGTAAGNQLRLRDRTTSRHHCVLTPIPRACLIRDLGSTNGTRVNGLRVESAYLKEAATIQVGISTIRYEPIPSAHRESLSVEHRFGQVVGKSVAMRRLFAMLPAVAASESNVLITGETGTGKGLLAKTIHEASDRKRAPFVVVDCGAIAPGLIERELFGHERGAYTGAEGGRPGVLETANRGTVFLDEIGELPLTLQPKLLRVLEERVIRRVGGNADIKLDVRIVAATNIDLRSAVNRGAFRADLYYRLNIAPFHLLPLRERPEDIPLLAHEIYKQLRPMHGSPPPELLDHLIKRELRGNVRELRAIIERVSIVGDLEDEAPIRESSSSIASLPVPNTNEPFRHAKEAAIMDWERSYLTALLDQHDGRLSRAARAAQMDRNYLRELVRRHGLARIKPRNS